MAAANGFRFWTRFIAALEKDPRPLGPCDAAKSWQIADQTATKWKRVGTLAVGQAFQPDNWAVRLESLTYVSVRIHFATAAASTGVLNGNRLGLSTTVACGSGGFWVE